MSGIKNDPLLPHVSVLLSRSFDKGLFDAASSLEQIEKLLTERVVYLLLHGMEELMQALYRVDVAEEKFRAALAQDDPSQVAPAIARLIMERTIQKAEYRIRHS